MKSMIAPALLLLLASCNNADEKKISMPGTYKMISYSVKTASTDSTVNNRQQVKMYSDNFMMYAGIEPDSLSLFGIGTYMVNGDTITERVIFSANDTLMTNGTTVFKLLAEKTAKGYKQVIQESADTRTEEYEAVGTDAASKLDGPWRQTTASIIRNGDTIMSINNQYKMYWKGHVIWGHNHIDSLKRIQTNIGIGTFEMVSDKKLVEKMTASFNYDVRNDNFDVDIEMTGNDQFKQTLTLADGSKSVEVYQRLK